MIIQPDDVFNPLVEYAVVYPIAVLPLFLLTELILIIDRAVSQDLLISGTMGLIAACGVHHDWPKAVKAMPLPLISDLSG